MSAIWYSLYFCSSLMPLSSSLLPRHSTQSTHNWMVSLALTDHYFLLKLLSPSLKSGKQCLNSWTATASRNTGFLLLSSGHTLKKKKNKKMLQPPYYLLLPLKILHAFQLRWVTEFPYFTNKKTNSESSATIHIRKRGNRTGMSLPMSHSPVVYA